MKKRVLSMLACGLLVGSMLAGCGESASESGSDSGTAANSGDNTSSSTGGSSSADNSGGEYLKIGYAAITMDGDFFVTLADALGQGCADLGLIENADDMVVLDAAWDTAAEVENMDTFISQQYDVVFIDTTNPDTMIPLIDQATEAGITVICVDSYVEECSRVTVVYGDNTANGFAAGKEYAEYKGDDFEIYSIMLSGVKGNIAGEQRRVGMIAGVLSVRLGLDQEEALERAQEVNDELVANNYVEVPEAKLTIAGQGWGNWSTEGIMNDANDLIVRTQGKLTTTFSEEDLMTYGAIQACEDAGVTGVDHVAAADGLKSAFERIRNGEMFCCSLNSPTLVGELAAQVAYEIEREGADPESYPDTMSPESICVTAENVDEYEYLAF